MSKAQHMEGFAIMDEQSKKWFDGTLNVNHVITLAVSAATLIGMYYSFSSRLSLVENQLGKLISVIELGIRQDEQLKALIRRVDSIENNIKK